MVVSSEQRKKRIALREAIRQGAKSWRAPAIRVTPVVAGAITYSSRLSMPFASLAIWA
jgi:hypothetical protein